MGHRSFGKLVIRGGKMKYYNKLVLFVIICLLACNSPQSMAESNPIRMPDLKIVATMSLSDTKKEVNFEAQYKVMEYKDGRLLLYEYIKKQSDDFGEYLFPKLNSDNKQVQLFAYDQEFASKLILTLNPTILASIEENQKDEPIRKLLVGIKKDEGWNYSFYTSKVINNKKDKYTNWISTKTNLKEESQGLSLPKSSIFAFDNDFNFQILKYTGKDFETIKTEAINPDFYYVHEIPYGEKMDEIPYKGGYYEGYIWMKTFSNKVCVWKEYEEIPHPLLILSENNQPAVDMYSLARFMLTPTSGDMKTHTFHRLYKFYSSRPVEYITVTFELGKNYAIVNGERKELEFAPFEKDDIFYVPLRDLCNFIKAPCHYRTTDNTALVARFFAPMNE